MELEPNAGNTSEESTKPETILDREMRLKLDLYKKSTQGTSMNDFSDLKIKPLNDRVVIAQLTEAPKSVQGLLVIEAAQATSKGLIVAVGEGKLLDGGNRQPMQVKVGDVVLVTPHVGIDIKVGKAELKVISEKDILAIIEQ